MHEGAVSPMFLNTWVRSMPPSKKSGGTTVWPTPSVASAVSHGVMMLVLVTKVPELVVAQIGSGEVAVLQSPPVPIGSWLQPPVLGSGLSLESMQPPSPE